MAEEFVLNYVTGEGSPEGSYRGLGVEPPGEEIEGEVVMGVRWRSGPGIRPVPDRAGSRRNRACRSAYRDGRPGPVRPATTTWRGVP
jgi:hypothetical protein